MVEWNVDAESGLRESKLLRTLVPFLPYQISTALALRWEGGQAKSRTLRRLLWERNGVRAGAYSYGGMLQLTRAPRHGLVIGRYASLSFTARWGINHHLNRISMNPEFDHSDAQRAGSLIGHSLHIGADAWIGDFAVITSNCNRIGIGAVVGAGSIVTRDVPDFAIVFGTPARIVRYRFHPDVQAKVLESEWWNHDAEKLRPWRNEFAGDAWSSEALSALGKITSEGRNAR